MFNLRKAEKAKTKMRLGLAGVSGSGKTYSALLLASGITSWEKICVIDSENGSADLYSTQGAYNVITLSAPFSPERYIEAVTSCEQAGMEVIIIDSITHEWDGPGGCLDIQEKLGGRYQDWAKVTPRHNAFVQKILQSPCHIITTVRKKQDYAMITEGGKSKVEKQGLKEVTREGFEYELTASFTINLNHLAEVSKDRTGLFMSKPPFIISSETGKMIKDWCETGVESVKPTVQVLQSALVSPLNAKLIEATIKLKGKDITKVLAHFNVPTVQMLTAEQGTAVMTKLKTLPNAPVDPAPGENLEQKAVEHFEAEMDASTVKVETPAA